MAETTKSPTGNPPLSNVEQTSHLKNFNPPKQTDAEIVAENLAEGLDDLKLPKTLKASHELLATLQAENPANEELAQLKVAKVAAVVAHIAKLGHGSLVVEINADDRRALHDSQSAHANELKLKLLAQTHPEVKNLLDENASLKEQISKLTKK